MVWQNGMLSPVVVVLEVVEYGVAVTGHERCVLLMLVYLTLANDQVLQSNIASLNFFANILPIL